MVERWTEKAWWDTRRVWKDTRLHQCVGAREQTKSWKWEGVKCGLLDLLRIGGTEAEEEGMGGTEAEEEDEKEEEDEEEEVGNGIGLEEVFIVVDCGRKTWEGSSKGKEKI